MSLFFLLRLTLGVYFGHVTLRHRSKGRAKMAASSKKVFELFVSKVPWTAASSKSRSPVELFCNREAPTWTDVRRPGTSLRFYYFPLRGGTRDVREASTHSGTSKYSRRSRLIYRNTYLLILINRYSKNFNCTVCNSLQRAFSTITNMLSNIKINLFEKSLINKRHLKKIRTEGIFMCLWIRAFVFQRRCGTILDSLAWSRSVFCHLWVSSVRFFIF